MEFTAATKLADRKRINAKLETLAKSKSVSRKTALRVEISALENEFEFRYGYRVSYNWEKSIVPAQNIKVFKRGMGARAARVNRNTNI